MHTNCLLACLNEKVKHPLLMKWILLKKERYNGFAIILSTKESETSVEPMSIILIHIKVGIRSIFYVFFFFFFSDIQGEIEPEFESTLQNVTFPLGREAVLTCTVRNLGRYKVREKKFLRELFLLTLFLINLICGSLHS